MATKTKILTVCLPLGLYQASGNIAERRQISLNALIQEGLTRVIKTEEFARLYGAFGQPGEDAEESDVKFAAHAQWEVISHGDT